MTLSTFSIFKISGHFTTTYLSQFSHCIKCLECPSTALQVQVLIQRKSFLPTKDIIKLNMAHEVNETDQANREARGLARTPRTNDRRWILKNPTSWLGWDPGAQKYMPDTLVSGGEVDYMNTFDPHVVHYKETKSINLIQSFHEASSSSCIRL